MKKAVLIFLLIYINSLVAQVCVWNGNSLEQAKTTNPISVALILKDATKELTKTIRAVTDKEMIPPSGDKHDYMSMGRYWWPDPTKSDGLPYIRKDGVSNPEIEKLDRYPLGDFARGVETLALAYSITSDEKFAQKAVENLRIWFINKETKMNPNMNFGQTVPGFRNGLGRGEGVLDTYSFVEMLDGVELLKKSKLFTTNDQLAIKEWFEAYVNWLQTSPVAKEEQEGKNNHGTAFDVQLARYAMFIGNQDLARRLVTEFPEKRLYKQIEPNGAQPLELERTTAFGYSVFNLTHFLDMCKIGQVLKIDLLAAQSSDGRSILKAFDFLIPFYGKPAADFPYKQIKDWEGVQQKLSWQLYRVDQMLPKPQYQKYYDEILKTDKKKYELVVY
ncbi:alginate lyase family protein [Flavobacterium sp. UMI-01]|uniref:alginate lyase family protein n=1 Tax=Flavobacterium sp. UMI-01 TaxID=1441053 RepID=UPI001C7DD9F8|nr:alginate lyase family protein [Flavobacterium sp. UMI-01]GIZ09407.1 hypothetical protein FUMI01_21340 [Flavobacterium sp. UMI-01]